MTTDYRPIACALHDQYEIAIMRKKPILIRWHDENGVSRDEEVFATDIQVKNGEEFLVATTIYDTERYIRLDKITLLS